MMRETFDETLDRVAARITAVPPDDTFVARLRPRLDESARHAVGLPAFAVAACLLALTIVATLVRHGDSVARPLTTAARSTSERPPATVVETSPGEPHSSARAEAATATNRTSAPVSTSVQIGLAAIESGIPPLSPPPDLDVAHLQLAPLIVHPVDVPTIEIVEISVTDLGAAEEPKE